MKKIIGALSILILCAWVPLAFADSIEAKVVEIDQLRQIIRICPVEIGCGVTEENMFIIKPDTKFIGIVNLSELEIGDRVVVEGSAHNTVVWKANTIRVT